MDLSDALVFMICVPNVIGLFLLAPLVKKEMNSFLARLKSGEIRDFYKEKQAQRRSKIQNDAA